MTIQIGEVIAVQGSKVTLRAFENSNLETLFHNGRKFKGVSIREYVAIRRGLRDIICIVEGEYLDERRFENDGAKIHYIRKVELKPIGYYEGDKFHQGIKFLPMINDHAFLLSEEMLKGIFNRGGQDEFVVGNLLKEDIPVSLPWERLFNSHIGIFGNTGSGKSNTLAKLYTLLFDQKSSHMVGTSNFVVLDFNGEYTDQQLIHGGHKTVVHLNTQTKQDTFALAQDEFWNTETLSILFQATTNTQRPFLNRVINGRKRFEDLPDSLAKYFRATFRRVFTTQPARGETLNLLKGIVALLKATEAQKFLDKVIFHGGAAKFTVPRQKGDDIWFNTDGAEFDVHLKAKIDSIQLDDLEPLDELVLRANLMLIRDLIYGEVQFEHIQPLMKRIDSSIVGLKKILSLEQDKPATGLLTVISLRKCKAEMKKILPLLIAKHFYHLHKDRVESPPDRTMHLVIDEAHNILSQQSAREHEVWKDYRLELFEEIIKEGRKFGMFLTLSSQRPADISPTIISQLHNFFIHRLVNDRDLFLLDNTISTLDGVSRSLIPNLAQGSCVVTGTSFEIPMVLQFDQLPKKQQPDSGDVDLKRLWRDFV